MLDITLDTSVAIGITHEQWHELWCSIVPASLLAFLTLVALYTLYATSHELFQLLLAAQ